MQSSGRGQGWKMGPKLLSARHNSTRCLDLTFSLHLWIALYLFTSRAWPRWRQRQWPLLTQIGLWTQRKRCFWEPPSYPHTRAGIYCLHIFLWYICIVPTPDPGSMCGGPCCCLCTHEIKRRFSSKQKLIPSISPKSVWMEQVGVVPPLFFYPQRNRYHMGKKQE